MSSRRPSLRRTGYFLLKDLLTFVRLALYQERRTKPRRSDPATRVALVVLSRWVDWRAMLTVVKPDTLIRWHRQGWRLFWRWKSSGRPPIPVATTEVVRMP